MAKKTGWIQKSNMKKGALSNQLGIPIKENIPMTLLNTIVAASPGDTIKNPTKIGKSKYKVTKLMERRSIMARNLKNMRKKK